MAAIQTVEIRAVDKTAKALGDIDKRLGKIDKHSQDIGISFGKIAALAGSVFAGLGLAKVTSNLVNTGKQLENLNVRLKFLFGSATEGAKAFDEMAEFAAKVPFSLEEIQQGAGVLSVVAKDADQLSNIMQITGNVAAVTGLDFKTASEQIQRSLSAGIASADIFREKGVRDMLGFKAGATVSAEETAAAFERVFGPGGKFGKATDALAGTLEGTLSMIGDKVFTFKKTILEAGLFDSLKVQFSELDKFLAKNSEAFNNVAQIIGDKLGFAVFQAAEFIKSLNINMEDLIIGAKIAAAVLGGAGLVAVLKGVTSGVKSLTLAMARNPLGLLAVAAASLITYLSMENGLGRTIAQVSAVMKTLGRIAGSIAQYFRDQLGRVLNYLTGVFDSFIDGVIKGYNAIARFIPFLDEVSYSGKQAREDVANLAVKGYEFLEEKVDNAKTAITNYVNTNELANNALNEAKALLDQLTNSWKEAGITYDTASEQQRKLYDDTMAAAKAQQEQKDKLLEQAQAAAKATENTNTLTEAQQKLFDASLGLGVTADLKKRQDAITEFYNAEIAKAKEANEFIRVGKETLYSREIVLTMQKNDELLKLEQGFYDKINAMQERSIQNKIKNDAKYFSTAEGERAREFLKRQGLEEDADALAKQQVENVKEYEKDKVGFVVGSLAKSMKALGQHNRKAFEAAKALAIAEAIMNTYSMAVAAFKSLAVIPVVGPVLGAAAAAAAIATGMAQVSAIRSQQYTGPRAQGGPVGANQSYLVGESGPEILRMGPNAGTIIPNDQIAQSPVTVNFNISTVDAEGFDELLIRRRATITGIINTALEKRGKVGVTG